VPAALMERSPCQAIRDQLSAGKTVIGSIDWSDAIPHPDDRVEWELWTDSNNGCTKCQQVIDFINAFASDASQLEQGGFTRFQPHFLTYHCLEEYLGSLECESQCISNGRYCNTDPDDDLERGTCPLPRPSLPFSSTAPLCSTQRGAAEMDVAAGYQGKDVVVENLRHLCVHDVANATGAPWLWWDYASQFAQHCKMDDLRFNGECAEPIIVGLGINLAKVQTCMGQVRVCTPLPGLPCASPCHREHAPVAVSSRQSHGLLHGQQLMHSVQALSAGALFCFLTGGGEAWNRTVGEMDRRWTTSTRC
jgi:hypothetical protein